MNLERQKGGAFFFPISKNNRTFDFIVLSYRYITQTWARDTSSQHVSLVNEIAITAIDIIHETLAQLGCAPRTLLLLHMHAEFYRGLSVDATESGRFLYRQRSLSARARVSRQCNFKFAMRRSVIKVV